MSWSWKTCDSPFFQIADEINPNSYKRAEDAPGLHHRNPPNKLLVSCMAFTAYPRAS